MAPQVGHGHRRLAAVIGAQSGLRVNQDRLHARGHERLARLDVEVFHQPGPKGQRAAGAGESVRLVVVAPDPDDRHRVAGKAGKPGVTIVVGGAGFSGQRQAAIDLLIGRAPGSHEHDLLQRPVGQVGRRLWQRLPHPQRKPRQRLSIGGQHFANRRQRGLIATGRQGGVHLRHFEGGDRNRAQQDRRQGLRRATVARAFQGFQHFGRPQIETDMHRRQVVGLRKHVEQRLVAMELAVVVLRRPDRAVRHFHLHRLIGKPAVEVITLGS